MKLYICYKVCCGTLNDLEFFKHEDIAQKYCDFMNELYENHESVYPDIYGYYDIDTDIDTVDSSIITDGRKNYIVTRSPEGDYYVELSWSPIIRVITNEVNMFNYFDDEAGVGPTFEVTVLTKTEEEALETGKSLIEAYIESRKPTVL